MLWVLFDLLITVVVDKNVPNDETCDWKDAIDDHTQNKVHSGKGFSRVPVPFGVLCAHESAEHDSQDQLDYRLWEEVVLIEIAILIVHQQPADSAALEYQADPQQATNDHDSSTDG